MTDILIRGMKMPHSCMDCRLNVGEKRPEHGMTIVCKYSNGVVLPEVIGLVGRLPTCGLSELPEHGDLIDRVAFRAEMDKHYPFDYGTQHRHGEADAAKSTVINMLANAPVVVQVSKEALE